jgi:hypothetical protein
LNIFEKILLGYNSGENPCRIENNREFVEEFKREIQFDSLLLETSKNFPKIRGLENDEKWFELINDTLQNNQSKTSLYSAHQWKDIVAETTNIRSNTLKNMNKISIRSWYLVAAVLLLSAISVHVILNNTGFKRWGKTISSVQKAPDTIVQKSSISGIDNHEEKNVTRSTNVIVLDSGSTVSIDPGAEIADIQIVSNKVSVSVVNGAVSFSVAKKKERSFIVRAGLADIVVTGTKFRVARIDDVLTVAVNEGTVNTVYKRGTAVTALRSGQVAILFGDTITVITNDSTPDFRGRNLMKNLIPSDESEIHAVSLTTKLVADSLINNLFIAGLHYNSKEDLLVDFCRILESKNRYKDAVAVLNQLNSSQSCLKRNANVSTWMSGLLIRAGDTSNALKHLKNQLETTNNPTEACKLILQLFKINSHTSRFLDADSCLLQYVKCKNTGSELDNLIINYAHSLRNASLFDMALYWYEYVLENFDGSKYRNDAEYWISFCVIQKGIVKRSTLKDSTGFSKW